MRFHGASLGCKHEIWSKQHNGKVRWVALVGNKVVAAGESVKEVKQKAEQAGYTDFMFHLVPSSSVLLAPYRRIA